MSAAVLYAATNSCLRQLSGRCDPSFAVWLVCIKESTSALVVGPWLAYRLFRGLQKLPSPRAVRLLALAGLTTQLAGNVFYFWAFSVLGLAVTTPVTMGVNLISSATLGRFLLGERVSTRSMLAIGTLICAVGLLSVNAAQAGHSLTTADQAKVLWGVGAAVLSGVAFSILGTTIRTTVTQATAPAVVIVTITGMGAVVLGPLSVCRLGPAAMGTITPGNLALTVTAGLLNLLAFTSYINGLKHTTIVHANVVNASQTALVTVAGVALFGESLNAAAMLGIGLTMAGMMFIDRPAQEESSIASTL